VAESQQPSRKRRVAEDVAEEGCFLGGCCLLDSCFSVVAGVGVAVWLQRRRR
jgi:hypothetical protein